MAGGKPRPVIEDGWLPTGAGRGLFYVRTANGGEEVVRRATASGRTQAVALVGPGEGEVTALGASSTHVAWVVSKGADSAQLHVKELASGTECQIVLHQRGPDTMVLNVVGHRVSWGSGSVEGDAGEYLFDASTQKLWKLGDSPGYSVAYLGPHVVTWAELKQDSGEAPRPRFVVASW